LLNGAIALFEYLARVCVPLNASLSRLLLPARLFDLAENMYRVPGFFGIRNRIRERQRHCASQL
jgi:hypothetical protein